MDRNPALTGFATMVRKEAVRIVRIWSQTLLPPVVTTSLYFAIFGAFIGSQVAAIQGFKYIQFIVPGLVMMSVITSAYMNTVSTFFFAKFQRNLEEILVSPMPNYAVIGGFIAGGVLRAFLVGILVLLVSLLFTHLVLFNIFVIVAAAFLTALLFSFAGLINGIFAKGFDSVSIVPTFVLTPLTYLGGIFYSIHQLPHFLQVASYANPILYMVNAFRYGFLGISDVRLSIAFAVMIVLNIILLVLSLVLFRRGAGFKH